MTGAGWILVLFVGLAILWASRADRRAGRILRALLALTAVFVALTAATVVAAFSWFNVSLGVTLQSSCIHGINSHSRKRGLNNSGDSRNWLGLPRSMSAMP